jgi:hypothetical protein
MAAMNTITKHVQERLRNNQAMGTADNAHQQSDSAGNRCAASVPAVNASA